MMHYEIQSWSHQYRQERLSEASTIHLQGKLRAARKERGTHNPISAFRIVLASLRATSESNDPLPAESIR